MAFDPTFLQPIFAKVFYGDQMDVYRRLDYVDERTCKIRQKEFLLMENIPCQVSKRKYNKSTTQTVGPNEEDFVATIFTWPGIDVRVGDRVIVREIIGGNVKQIYEGYIGVSRPYSNQQGFDVYQKVHA